GDVRRERDELRLLAAAPEETGYRRHVRDGAGEDVRPAPAVDAGQARLDDGRRRADRLVPRRRRDRRGRRPRDPGLHRRGDPARRAAPSRRAAAARRFEEVRGRRRAAPLRDRSAVESWVSRLNEGMDESSNSDASHSIATRVQRDMRRYLVIGSLSLPAFLPKPRAETVSVPPDSPRWELQGNAKPVDQLGRRCLLLDGGAAIVKDLEMRDGVVDVDVATSAIRGFF